MRQIKLRAKTVNEGEWVYGMTISHGTVDRKRNCLFFEVAENKWKGVIPDTLGQFTGLTDRNGKEIYEGDIVRYGEFIYHVIEFKHGMFGYTLADGWFVGYGGNSNFTFNPLDKSKEHEIIGNIHDNPELLNQPTEV